MSLRPLLNIQREPEWRFSMIEIKRAGQDKPTTIGNCFIGFFAGVVYALVAIGAMKLFPLFSKVPWTSILCMGLGYLGGTLTISRSQRWDYYTGSVIFSLFTGLVGVGVGFFLIFYKFQSFYLAVTNCAIVILTAAIPMFIGALITNKGVLLTSKKPSNN